MRRAVSSSRVTAAIRRSLVNTRLAAAYPRQRMRISIAKGSRLQRPNDAAVDGLVERRRGEDRQPADDQPRIARPCLRIGPWRGVATMIAILPNTSGGLRNMARPGRPALRSQVIAATANNRSSFQRCRRTPTRPGPKMARISSAGRHKDDVGDRNVDVVPRWRESAAASQRSRRSVPVSRTP